MLFLKLELNKTKAVPTPEISNGEIQGANNIKLVLLKKQMPMELDVTNEMCEMPQNT